VSLPLAHFAPPVAPVADEAADVATAPALLAAVPDVAAAAGLDVAPVVAGALVELELLPHAVAVRATAIPTDAT
jgi:hypothetical protein